MLPVKWYVPCGRWPRSIKDKWIPENSKQSLAKAMFLNQVSNLRFGPEMKDYYWIHDLDSVILAHPYSERIDLSLYTDRDGLRVVPAMNEMVLKHGEGFLKYYWQWKDDPDREELKVSFVKLFEPWGWVIGSGFYVDETREAATVVMVSFLRYMALFGAAMVLLTWLSLMRSLRSLDQFYAQETKLDQTASRIRTMADRVAHGIGILEGGALVFRNAQLFEILGLEETHSDPIQLLKSRIDSWSDVDQSRNQICHLWFEMPSGESKFLQVVVSVDADRDESYWVVRDLTESKRTEEALIQAKNRAEESERIKSAFLANISHEVRTPLNAISGFGQLLSDPNLELSADEVREYQEIIISNIALLTHLVDDILRISEIESGSFTPELKSVSLGGLMKDVFHQAREFLPQSVKPGVGFIMDPIDPEICDELLTDRDMILQILMELVDNAFKFTASGSIHFGCRLLEGVEVLYVADTGCGIADEDKPRVFSRFFHGSGDSVSLHSGAGLGLYLVKRYVAALGGRAWFEANPGEEPCFTWRGSHR
jgi:signal transduction histidine kinase